MKARNSNWLKHLDFTVGDILALELAFLLSFYTRHGGMSFVGYDTVYRNIAILLPVIEVCLSLGTDIHHNIIRRGAMTELRMVAAMNTAIWGMVIVFAYLLKQSEPFSRTVYLVGIVYSITLMFSIRQIRKTWVRRRLKRSGRLPKLLLVTTRERADQLIEAFKSNQYSGYHVVGIALIGADADDAEVTDLLAEIPVIRHRDGLKRFLLEEVVNDVMVSLPPESVGRENLINGIVNSGAKIHINLEFAYGNLPNRYVENLNGYSVLTGSVSRPAPLALSVKRLVDIIGSVIGLILCGVAALIFGPAIYHASPGPIFFSQVRVGKNGRRFRIYKFRSMYLDAEVRKQELMNENEMSGMMFKMDNDPRIIGSEKGAGKGIGNFIRKTSIDELPEFWNVLKGDMSLVGTRPPTVDEYEQYELHHMIRLSMKPGITGMWQVSGRSNIKDFEEVVRLDEAYIANWSLGLDLSLLLKTVAVVLRRDGAE